MSQYVDLERMHVYECGGTVVYQLLCGRDLAGEMNNYIYLIVNTHDRTAAVIDAAWDLDAIYGFAAAQGVQIKRSIYTHAHADHAGGNGVPGCKEVLHRGTEIWAGQEDADVIQKQCCLPEGALRTLGDGDLVALGDLALHVLHTPGHTPGSICILLTGVGALTPREPFEGGVAEIRVPVRGNLLISGDTMFVGGAGRTDLRESNHEHMLESLLRLAELPADTLVLPGHNYDPLAYTTIDIENGGNCYILNAKDKRTQGRLLPNCCCCSSPRGPRQWRPGQRVELTNESDGSTEVVLVEDWVDSEGSYAVQRFCGGAATARLLVPLDRLRARGKAASGDSEMPPPSFVAYRVIHGILLRKDDPVSSGASACKVASSRRPVGSLVHSTGREWTGAQGTTWVELDLQKERRGGWLALHGRCFGIDAELLRREPL